MKRILTAIARHAAEKRQPPVAPPFRFRENLPDKDVRNPITVIISKSSKSLDVERAAIEFAAFPSDIAFQLVTNETEARKDIESAISAGAPHVAFELPRKVSHLDWHALSHYATCSSVSLRPLYQKEHKLLPVNTRILILASNWITFSPDLHRSSRIIELL